MEFVLSFSCFEAFVSLNASIKWGINIFFRFLWKLVLIDVIDLRMLGGFDREIPKFISMLNRKCRTRNWIYV